MLIYSHFHNILRLPDVSLNFPFTAIETMCDYYIQIWYIRVAEQVKNVQDLKDLRKLGKIRKVSKLH